MIQLYEEGASDHEVCRELKCSYADFDKRYKTDSIFAQLVDFGRLASKAWWLTLGRKGAMGGKNFNFQAWYANMKNRFGWSDKAEISSGDDKPLDQLTQDELLSKISSHKARLAKLLNKSGILFANIEDGTSN